ncbi:hypothetical protein YC2023_114319 [Brassica napus]
MDFRGFSLIRLVYMMQKARIQIWLFEQKDLKIEGRIIVQADSLLMIFVMVSVSGFECLQPPPPPSPAAVLTNTSYMNLVLDEAEEVSIKKNTRKPLAAGPTMSTNKRTTKWRQFKPTVVSPAPDIYLNLLQPVKVVD